MLLPLKIYKLVFFSMEFRYTYCAMVPLYYGIGRIHLLRGATSSYVHIICTYLMLLLLPFKLLHFTCIYEAYTPHNMAYSMLKYFKIPNKVLENYMATEWIVFWSELFLRKFAGETSREWIQLGPGILSFREVVLSEDIL